MNRLTVRIATRGSPLALWQARNVAQRLTSEHPDLEVELVEVVSTGDLSRDQPMHQLGAVGIFTKEIQDAVLSRSADVAVHSLKDLPTESHPELVLAAVPERGRTEDAFLAPAHRSLARLPPGSRVATSSPRRRAQLLRRRPDLQIVEIRGNVETRVRKLSEQSLDGLVLAAAGLDRLGLLDQATEILPADLMLPAPGQGALGIECRADDNETRLLLASLEHAPTRQCVEAERAFLARLKGGCRVPIGALAQIKSAGSLTLRGIVLDLDGKRWFDDSTSAPPAEDATIGVELADRLLARGAGELMGRG